jgi:hypothetical protein
MIFKILEKMKKTVFFTQNTDAWFMQNINDGIGFQEKRHFFT